METDNLIGMGGSIAATYFAVVLLFPGAHSLFRWIPNFLLYSAYWFVFVLGVVGLWAVKYEGHSDLQWFAEVLIGVGCAGLASLHKLTEHDDPIDGAKAALPYMLALLVTVFVAGRTPRWAAEIVTALAFATFVYERVCARRRRSTIVDG
jgi:hypothetical protein